MTLAHTRYLAHASAPRNAPPFVLVHGLGGTQYTWEPIVEQLRNVAEVITLDLPGFGDSPEPDDAWSLDGAAAAIIDLLDHLEIERCILVGHSLGGGVVIVAGATYPERFAAVGLVSPAGFAGTGDGEVSSQAVAIHAAWRAVLRVGPTQLLRIPELRRRVFVSLVHDPDVIDAEQAREFARGVANGRSGVSARAAILAANLFGELPKLTMPVALVWGREDRIVPYAYAPRVAAEIPNVVTTWLADVGHIPIWENSDQVVEALTALAARA